MLCACALNHCQMRGCCKCQLYGGSCTAVCVGMLFGNHCRSETPSKLCWGSARSAQPYEDSRGYIGKRTASDGKQLQQRQHNGFSNKDHTFNDAGTTRLRGRKKGVYYMIWHTGWVVFKGIQRVCLSMFYGNICVVYVTGLAKCVTAY